jgi:hypothetical protein
MSELALLTGADSKSNKLYVDDVFSAYTYTGNGATQTINNGIDLAGKGGLVWMKSRTTGQGRDRHFLIDTERGLSKTLISNDTSSQYTYNQIASVTSTGYVDANGWLTVENIVSWTFRKAPKFFDIVTYTGNGVDQRILSHNLGIIPGLVIIKRTDAASNWVTWHIQFGNTNSFLRLNTTDSIVPGAEAPVIPLGSSTQVYITDLAAANDSVNINGATYVAYLFAHDESSDSIIKCGSFTTDGSGNATVDLGWEPQYVMTKNSSGTSAWRIFDTSRAMTVAGQFDALLQAQVSTQEFINSDYCSPTATGFSISGHDGSATFIYIAIRRSNKPPTLGTEVYNAIARTGTGAGPAIVTGVGFAPDFSFTSTRNVGITSGIYDRLRGANKLLQPSQTQNEFTSTEEVLSFDMDGVKLGSSVGGYTLVNVSGNSYINHYFKRAVGVFDEVCYTGTNGTTSFNHGLTVKPELILIKPRGITANWEVHFNYGVSNYGLMYLNQDVAKVFDVNPPTASTFLPQFSNTSTNVAYLFASKAGISKVFSYTGNGTSKTIDCGFTTGARFIMIKRTDSTGDWYVWDSVRGIVASNDPHLMLNTYATEVTTDDSVDPNVLGFVVNQVAATNINVSAGTYIGLAFA